MEKYKVSILIPVYNRKDIILETLQSATEQTYTNKEIIVVDNKSTDDTFKIIKDFSLSHGNVKVYQNEKNIGPVKNWRKCLEYASGEYGKILWSDDLIAPDFLEKTVPYLEQKDVGFVYSPAEIFGPGIMQPKVCYDLGRTGVYPSDKFIQGSLYGGAFPVSPGCALFRIEDLRNNLLVDIPNKVGSDFSQHAIGNDVLLFLKTAAQYDKFAFVKETKAFFRAHSGSITSSSNSGKIPLFYALAKAYFLENSIADKKSIEKFNGWLLCLLYRYKTNKYNFKEISDFYLKNKNYSVDYFFLFSKVIKKIIREII
jgi:glycosyltransferase involved in cell wall biosynthesis